MSLPITDNSNNWYNIIMYELPFFSRKGGVQINRVYKFIGYYTVVAFVVPEVVVTKSATSKLTHIWHCEHSLLYTCTCDYVAKRLLQYHI